jgi:hypothetical protein
MSILDKVKAIFRINEDTGKKEQLPVDKFGHGNEIQKLADETGDTIEIHIQGGSVRHIHPKDVFVDTVTKRHTEVVW